VWNNEGQYLAYSTPDNGDESQSILVLKHIGKGNTLLRKDIGKYVSDINWSPDSSRVALLTYTARIGLLPWELLLLAAGHPSFNSTFYLEVYDLSGNLIFNKKIDGNFKTSSRHSKGRLVWIP
jgi:dipeptidyl aminopeptidase/acylaminoacyl peptidase